MGEHAVLAASASKRWLTCPPSARLEESMPKSTSAFAEEGRLAHRIGEVRLVNRFFNFTQAEPETPDTEMSGYVDEYVNFILDLHKQNPDQVVRIEQQFDLKDYIPGGFGTSDYSAVNSEVLDVVDLKYGKGVFVKVENNPQFMIYALGVYQLYGWAYEPKVVRMHVVQPRMDNINTWEIPIEELLRWGDEVLRPAAAIAYMGRGEFKPSDECQFCKAKAVCRARAENYTALEDFGSQLPPLLSDEEVGQILLRGKGLASWVKDLEKYVLTACLSGATIPGWKAVEGRSVRAFSDADKAFKALIAGGIQEALLYERKPLSLAAAEKVVGKKPFAELVGEYIIKPQGTPSLATEDDKRPAITGTISVEEDFAEDAE